MLETAVPGSMALGADTIVRTLHRAFIPLVMDVLLVVVVVVVVNGGPLVIALLGEPLNPL
jgi:hypothetical protein